MCHPTTSTILKNARKFEGTHLAEEPSKIDFINLDFVRLGVVTPEIYYLREFIKQSESLQKKLSDCIKKMPDPLYQSVKRSIHTRIVCEARFYTLITGIVRVNQQIDTLKNTISKKIKNEFNHKFTFKRDDIICLILNDWSLIQLDSNQKIRLKEKHFLVRFNLTKM